MELINGRGQLGERLKGTVDLDVVIYHTWNFLDKREETQLKEYKRFVEFLSTRPKNLLFISTLSREKNAYTYYKRKAEESTLLLPDSSIIRLPNLIGKGICQRFKENKTKPSGKIELMSLDEATLRIIDVAAEKNRGRIYNCHGEEISAELAYNLIQFGKE